VRDYLRGARAPMIDLMAWNADATRMPYRMHSEYLRRLFLNNDLAAGRYMVDDKQVTLRDIRSPIFAVGTVRDHVAPWRSTYKINFLADSDVTYLLTTGGHNAGIVSEPGHDHRSYQVLARKEHDHYVDPDTFLQQAQHKEGSWWPEWVSWLNARSGEPIAPPAMGTTTYVPLADAPGTYVLQQ
jgi:polyhydroxyalkanoate synthase